MRNTGASFIEEGSIPARYGVLCGRIAEKPKKREYERPASNPNAHMKHRLYELMGNETQHSRLKIYLLFRGHPTGAFTHEHFEGILPMKQHDNKLSSAELEQDVAIW